MWEIVFEAEHGDPTKGVENKTNNRHVFWSQKRGCHVLFSKDGLYQVEKVDPDSKYWSHVKKLMSSDQIKQLIESRKDHTLKTLGELISDILRGEEVEEEYNGTVRFKYEAASGPMYLRYRPTDGLSIVELAIDNWVGRVKIMDIESLYACLITGNKKQEVKDAVRRECDRYADQLQRRGAA
jgi:hypothetical protein